MPGRDGPWDGLASAVRITFAADGPAIRAATSTGDAGWPGLTGERAAALLEAKLCPNSP
jgi:hypothetical protein